MVQAGGWGRGDGLDLGHIERSGVEGRLDQVEVKGQPGPVERARGRMRLPALLRMFWIGSVAMFGLMVLLSYIEYRMGFKQPHYNPLGGDRS